MVVGLEETLLDDDEIAALCRGPKFCVRRVLDEERFLMECEKSCFKLRIDMYDCTMTTSKRMTQVAA